jgi:hypothetical protein
VLTKILRPAPILLVASLLWFATPGAGQSPAPTLDPATAEPWQVVPSRTASERAALLVAQSRPVEWRAYAVPLTLETRQPRRRGAVLLGAAAGGAAGAAAFLLVSDGCWRAAESMCELAIPLYVGAGAVTGGLIAHVLGRRSP